MLLRQVVLRMKVAQEENGTVRVYPVVYNPTKLDSETLEWTPDMVDPQVYYENGQWHGIRRVTITDMKTKEPKTEYIDSVFSPEQASFAIMECAIGIVREAVKDLSISVAEDVENGRILEDCGNEE